MRLALSLPQNGLTRLLPKEPVPSCFVYARATTEEQAQTGARGFPSDTLVQRLGANYATYTARCLTAFASALRAHSQPTAKESCKHCASACESSLANRNTRDRDVQKDGSPSVE